jgi:hypothetical protein
LNLRSLENEDVESECPRQCREREAGTSLQEERRTLTIVERGLPLVYLRVTNNSSKLFRDVFKQILPMLFSF